MFYYVCKVTYIFELISNTITAFFFWNSVNVINPHHYSECDVSCLVSGREYFQSARYVCSYTELAAYWPAFIVKVGGARLPTSLEYYVIYVIRICLSQRHNNLSWIRSCMMNEYLVYFWVYWTIFLYKADMAMIIQ